VTPPLGARGPAYGGEYCTPNLRLALPLGNTQDELILRNAGLNVLKRIFFLKRIYASLGLSLEGAFVLRDLDASQKTK
jgi:hypothetical protein